MLDYLRALALTLVMEVPVYAVGLHGLLDVTARRGAVVGVAVNLATHPAAFLAVMPRLATATGPSVALTMIEISAWAVETALLFAWLRRDLGVLAAIAFVANALSFSAGLAWLR